jgi:hypothetical protein
MNVGNSLRFQLLSARKRKLPKNYLVRDIQERSEVDLALDPDIQSVCTVLLGMPQ